MRTGFCLAVIVAALTLSVEGSSGQAAGGLRIVVISGEDAVNIVQQRTAVAPVVEVRDRNNQPVAGASVTFVIDGGKNAAFAGGSPTVTVTTNAAGRAATGTLTPLNGGSFQIQVQAAYQGQTAAATIAQTNVLTAAQAAAATAGGAGGGGIGGLTIAGIVGGIGAAVAVAATTLSGNGGGSAATSASPPSATTPTTAAPPPPSIPTPAPTPGPTPTPTPTPTPAPAPVETTGRWMGLSPDGIILEPGPGACSLELDLTLDLVANGTSVTGTASLRERKVADGCGGLGSVDTSSIINGRLGPGTISFSLPAGGSNTIDFSGTFTATRMNGTLITFGGRRGVFSVSRP
jgi:hypothetical protein